MRRLQQADKTVVVTSHDLSAINEPFDRALLLNRRVVAFGPPEAVFTPEKLDEAYGGRLTMLRMGDGPVAVEDGGKGGRG